MRRRRRDELLRRLESELRPHDAEPVADRVAELRAAAEARRAGAASARERRLSRGGFLAAGAGAAAGAAGGIGLYEILDEEPPSVPTEQIALIGAPAGVTANAELINHTWGVELLLTVSGLDAAGRYAVRYLTTDGEQVAAGSFIGIEAEQLCRMTGALLREETRAIEVIDEGGAVVLRSEL